ncbi:MAG: arginase [Flavobacteriaceae bacterium]|nr:arginase [Flavobacteriaceae bacterium]
MNSDRQIHIIKLISDLGANPAKPGAAKGPDALLKYDAERKNIFSGALVSEVKMEQIDRDAEKQNHPLAKYCNYILPFQRVAAEQVKLVLQSNQFPFVLSGDHSSAAAVLTGLRQSFPNQKIGVIWVDAHADLHTPYTTPSGNMHGMPVAISLAEDNLAVGHNHLTDETAYWEQLKNNGSIQPKITQSDLLYVELRDLEEEEITYIQKHQIKNYTPAERKEKGIGVIADEVTKWAAGFDKVYVTFDIDSMDIEYVPGTGTPVADGFSPEAASILLQALWQMPNLAVFEVTEINPELDVTLTTLESVYSAIGNLKMN